MALELLREIDRSAHRNLAARESGGITPPQRIYTRFGKLPAISLTRKPSLQDDEGFFVVKDIFRQRKVKTFFPD